MKKFNSIFDAVRNVKKCLPEDNHDELYLMWHEDRDRFYVSDSTDDLEKQIDEDFYNWGYDGDTPEEHADKYKIWSYTQAENMERWPTLYRGYKRSPLSKTHLRGKANAAGEIVASFSISRY